MNTHNSSKKGSRKVRNWLNDRLEGFSTSRLVIGVGLLSVALFLLIAGLGFRDGSFRVANIFGLQSSLLQVADTSDRAGMSPSPASIIPTVPYEGGVLSSQSDLSLTLLPNEQKQITISIQNRGRETWYREKPEPNRYVALGTASPANHQSGFSHQTWFQPGTRPARISEASVKTGEVATLTFTIVAPSRLGTFTDSFELVDEWVAWIPGTHVALTVNVISGYTGEVVSIDSSSTLTMVTGDVRTITVQMKNTGRQPWIADTGSSRGYTALATINPQNRRSPFADETWFMNGARATRVDQATVHPGETAPFTFTIKAPAPGAYVEKFQLVSEYVSWIPGTEITLTIGVNNGYTGEVVSISPAQDITMNPGEKKTITLMIKNVNVKPWIADTGTSSGYVALGTSNPHNRRSPFADETWFMNGARATRVDQATVHPGETAPFTFTITAPHVGGRFSEQFQVVAEYVTWIAGTTVSINITVNPPTGAEASPSVRVGITQQTTTTVKANGPYAIHSLQGAVIKTITDGSESRDVVSGRSHAVSNGAWTTIQSDGVRFVAINGSILQVTSYDARPSWNPSINDNLFRHVIEVRTSTSNGATWVINELPVEYYLYGMAEATNDTHSEMLKVMATIERSYVLYHRNNGGKHPAEGFDVDNRYDQVYKGYGFELRAPNIKTAVDATRGKVVAYQGTPVITPYYSRSDGRTRSWTEVWGGSYKPWLVSVPDPDCAGFSLSGHGVGLSAYGANKRAMRGESMASILSYYYQGSSLVQMY